MSKKYLIVFGLFLAASFVFLNFSVVKAETWTWTGGGDTHSWTDPANWGLVNTSHGGLTKNFPGATTTADVVIGGGARVIATTTISSTGGLGSLTLGLAASGNNSGSILTIAGDATIAASSTVTLYSTSTLAFGDNSANTNAGAALNLGAGNLYLGLYNVATTSYPLNIGKLATFTAGTSTVTYAGVGRAYIATTTYYNLTLTPTSTAAIVVYTVGAGGNATTTKNLTINAAAQLNFNGAIFELSGSGTPLVASSSSAFVANGSRIVYSGTSVTSVATGTYATLEISGNATKSLVGNTTAVTAARVNSTATLAVGSYTATFTGAIVTNAGTLTMGSTGTLAAGSSTFTNSGTLTLGGSAVTLTSATFANSGTVTITTGGVVTATGATWTNTGTGLVTNGGTITLASSLANFFSNSACSTAASSYAADNYPIVYVGFTDPSLNLDASSAEATQTGTITSTSGITDSESITLTETGNATGLFCGGISVQLSGDDVAGKLDYQGSGTLALSYIDSEDTSDTGSASASFTGTTAGGGGGGGGGAAAVTTTTTVTPAPTTVATTVTPAVTPVAPTLESVSTKVASVVAKIAALPTNPTASDLASIQAEIAAILVELQSIQAAQPTPQGVALGFNFVRPLALGLRHADVSNLQKALKTDSSIYPEGLVTGYFGSMTLKAVQKFQEKYNIASSGKAGYGNVGPATRAKLNELYGSK